MPNTCYDVWYMTVASWPIISNPKRNVVHVDRPPLMMIDDVDYTRAYSLVVVHVTTHDDDVEWYGM